MPLDVWLDVAYSFNFVGLYTSSVPLRRCGGGGGGGGGGSPTCSSSTSSSPSPVPVCRGGAGAVLFAVENGFITGTTIDVDGGWLLHK
jgi:hypothetical protein